MRTRPAHPITPAYTRLAHAPLLPTASVTTCDRARDRSNGVCLAWTGGSLVPGLPAQGASGPLRRGHLAGDDRWCRWSRPTLASASSCSCARRTTSR
eukprot:1040172-Prorocentrum_minimum.AAC.1